MKEPPKTYTKQQTVYRELREGIMSGRLTPGTRLIIEKIALRMGVSAIPVREALSQLEKEGLVRIKPHAGAMVSDIPETAIEEIFALLEALECVGCRLGIKRLGLLDLEELRALTRKMEATDDAQEWLTLNRRFHDSVPRLAGLTRLEELLIRVGEDWERLRRLRFANREGQTKADADRQHREILRAMEQGDEEAAVAFIRQHNQEALRKYVGHQSEASAES